MKRWVWLCKGSKFQLAWFDRFFMSYPIKSHHAIQISHSISSWALSLNVEYNSFSRVARASEPCVKRYRAENQVAHLLRVLKPPPPPYKLWKHYINGQTVFSYTSLRVSSCRPTWRYLWRSLPTIRHAFIFGLNFGCWLLQWYLADGYTSFLFALSKSICFSCRFYRRPLSNAHRRWYPSNNAAHTQTGRFTFLVSAYFNAKIRELDRRGKWSGRGWSSASMQDKKFGSCQNNGSSRIYGAHRTKWWVCWLFDASSEPSADLQPTTI